MINIKNFVSRNGTLISNFSYLSLLQIFNLLIPFVTYPFLIRVLGKDTYGFVIYAQVVVSYLLILVGFGFDTLAIKEASINRHNVAKLSEIFSSLFLLKGIIFIFSLIVLGLIVSFLPDTKSDYSLFYLSMWVCLYDVIFPTWYFQGVEKMKYITILSLISRSVFLVLIFVLIKTPADYLKVPLINGIGAVISGGIALYILTKKEKLYLYFPKWSILKSYIINSFDFFISTVFIKLFVSSNKFVIGTFIGMKELAYYDLADKIVALFRNIPNDLVRTTIFPLVAKTKDFKIVKRVTIIMSVYSVFAVLLLNLFADFFVRILGGIEMIPSIGILKLYSLIIITNNISNYYITVGLWSAGYIKVFRNMMILSSVFYLIFYLIFWLAGSIDVYTVTLIPILIDIYLVAHIFIFWNKRKPHLNIINNSVDNI